MKQQLLEIYAKKTESVYPGKGAAACGIINKYWDSKSERLLEKEMQLRSGMPDSVVVCVLRDLVNRFPSMNDELKFLKQ